MKAAGVIVEYNPFHNGHYFHIKETKAMTGADVVIAAMSGNFLQRGEPALISKWQRTKAALLNGVDLVFELPYSFATQKADTFASGAVSILNALQVDSLCFGSESGDISHFHNTYQILKEQHDSYNKAIKMEMDKGVSYPRAAAQAFQQLQQNTNIELLDLTLPNNILGFQYVKAIHDQRSTITPFTIKRTGSGYHDTELTSHQIASATSIRKAIFSENEITAAKGYLPNKSYATIQEYHQHYNMLHTWEKYFPLLKYRLLTANSTELEAIYESEEGVHHRLKSLISEAPSFHAFMEAIKTKRYTWTRLQRLCTHILTNTQKELMEAAAAQPQVPYLRLLGMTTHGQHYLNSVKKELALPLVATLSQYHHPLLELDIKAAYTYASILDEPLRSQFMKAEFATPPLQV